MLSVACTGERGELKIESVASSLKPAQTGDGAPDIARASIEVSEIELEGGQEDEREATMGEGVIEVALNGNPTTVAVDAVEAGSYHTLGIEMTGIRVEGTISGASFDYRSNIKPEVEFELDPEVEVPALGSASVGVSFDVASWFRAADGRVLDPNDAANQSEIEARILESMAANAVIEDESNESD